MRMTPPGWSLKPFPKVGPDRAKIREYLASINSKEKAYKGITGLTYFNDMGDCEKPAYVKMVKNGQFVPAEKADDQIAGGRLDMI